MDDIRISSGAYGRYVIGEYLKSNAWWMILLALAAAVASIYDYKFILVAFMILLIVMPMIMSFVYFKYALHPLSRYSILPKSVVLITSIDMLQIQIRDDEGNITETVTYNLNEFDTANFGSSLLAFRYRGAKYTYLIFPINIFSKSDINYLMNKYMPVAALD